MRIINAGTREGHEDRVLYTVPTLPRLTSAARFLPVPVFDAPTVAEHHGSTDRGGKPALVPISAIVPAVACGLHFAVDCFIRARAKAGAPKNGLEWCG